MSDQVLFLTSFVQTLSTMKLYSPGHPARSKAVDSSFAQLGKLLSANQHPRYSFLEEKVIYGDLPIHELPQWPWAPRLAAVGVQRMEFDASVTRNDYENFLDHVLNLLSTADDDLRLGGRRTTVKFGHVGVREGEEVVKVEEIPTHKVAYTLDAEVGVVQWLQQRAAEGDGIGIAEVESVVRSLAVAMHQSGKLMAPLLELKTYDQYASLHALNTAVLVMTFAESLGLGDQDCHQFGMAAVVHDIGMTTVPPELQAGNNLNPEERAIIEQHPVEGARILLASRDIPPLAATVAFGRDYTCAKAFRKSLRGSPYPARRQWIPPAALSPGNPLRQPDYQRVLQLRCTADEAAFSARVEHAPGAGVHLRRGGDGVRSGRGVAVRGDDAATGGADQDGLEPIAIGVPSTVTGVLQLLHAKDAN